MMDGTKKLRGEVFAWIWAIGAVASIAACYRLYRSPACHPWIFAVEAAAVMLCSAVMLCLVVVVVAYHRKMIAELGRFVRLVVRYRGLKVGRVTKYAEVALKAAEVVDTLRERYPSSVFVCSYTTNHVLDSFGEYVCLWEVTRNTLHASLIFKGPVKILAGQVAEGYYDGVFPRSST